MNTGTVLITADPNEAASTIQAGKQNGFEFIHLPLEWMETNPGITHDALAQEIHDNDIIVLGSYRNTYHFLNLVEQFELQETVRVKLNFTMTRASANLLEANGVPGISSHPHIKAIHLLELIIRLGQLRPAVYPQMEEALEEMPALFEELDVPCHTLPVCTRKYPDPDQLKKYRQRLRIDKPDYVFIHDKDMIRYLAVAFSELDLQSVTVIAANQTVTNELKKRSIPCITTKEAGFPTENFWQY
ncbi:MAG TPA: hypothetical protein VKA08_00185 [Balneolales bacterium]|nr:hypothetical protein [Balneolales bacterium]